MYGETFFSKNRYQTVNVKIIYWLSNCKIIFLKWIQYKATLNYWKKINQKILYNVHGPLQHSRCLPNAISLIAQIIKAFIEFFIKCVCFSPSLPPFLSFSLFIFERQIILANIKKMNFLSQSSYWMDQSS